MGLSGIFGGYTYQKYDAQPILEVIKNSWNLRQIKGQDISFDKAMGFRVGANILRAQFSSLSVGFKGFYQFLRSNNEIEEFVNSEKLHEKYELRADYWGVGIDFDFALFRRVLDFKLVDAGVTFHSPKLIWTSIKSDVEEFRREYKSPELEISYFAGSGIVLHVIPDYVSVEGTAFMSFYELKNLIDKESGDSFAGSGKKLISNNQISYSVQLNLGFPL